ncbi:DUF7523 family protein [Haloferacaceae archaeon DSL9]
MSLAADARAAIRRNPFLHAALRAGVLNYRAAADFLALDGDADAVATALRRYAGSASSLETENRSATVRMRSGVGPADPDASADPLLRVGGVVVAAGGDNTAVVATGAVDPSALAAVLGRLAVEDVRVHAAGVADGTLVVTVDRRDGPDAVRFVEDALRRVPR